MSSDMPWLLKISGLYQPSLLNFSLAVGWGEWILPVRVRETSLVWLFQNPGLVCTLSAIHSSEYLVSHQD